MSIMDAADLSNTQQLNLSGNSGSASITPQAGVGPKGDTGATGAKGDTGATGAPGGSDAATAGWVESGPLTTAALNAAYAALLATVGDISSTSTNGALTVGQVTRVDASGGTRAMTLADGTAKGQVCAAEKYDSSINAVTVTGKLRSASASSFTLTYQYETVLFAWMGTYWEPLSGHRTKSSIDAQVQAGVSNPSTVVPWGDSHTQYGGGIGGASAFTGSNPIYRCRGYWSWASQRLNGRLQLLNNAGVAGQRTGQILARWSTDVAPFKPGWVIIEGGTNNVNFDVTSTSSTIATVVAQVKSDILAMIALVQAAGARAVVVTLPPVNSFITNQNIARDQLNRWIKSLATSSAGKVVVCDWNPYICAYSASSPQWLSGYSFDGTHGNAMGCARMGYALAQVLDPLVPKTDQLPGYQDTLNLLANCAATGTGGSLATGITGQVATGWATGVDGTSATVVASKVARTDGIIGEWQQFAVSAANTGFRYFQTISSGYNIGGTYVAMVEYQTDSDITVSSLTEHYVELIAFGSPNVSAYSRKNADSDSLNDAYCRLPSGVLITAPLVIPAGTTSLRLQTHLDGATGTVRYGRADLIQIA